ncbi:adenylate kinase family protein [Natrialbaceae archaeon AArc-T1-2]|uniref:adenylate kinase family protein n=1 Tax=Natrialbaceae archaeon AArc-T1-2 TaxID=3053904 RepID=UPI00255AE87B|nr:adenylate kinase family protein [Natrialbaceae archaeon AArc-T1-2]WIV67516.1 adenylate kinase family protein [Natrialbaceae archaeon AArc-T1-2]
MRVAVTGTPGTGKTTATDRLETCLEVLHLNELIEDDGLYEAVDADRDSVVADLEALEERLAEREDVVIESHLAHHLEADRVAVLRCRPDELERRLSDRGESEEKAAENAESEALDVILAEAVENHGLESVYEIDTTGREPEAVAADLEAVIAGEREPSAGEVDFLEFLS